MKNVYLVLVTADLLITSGVFWVYMFSRSEGPAPWLFIVLNLTIGLTTGGTVQISNLYRSV